MNNIKENIEFLGLDYKKEIIKISLVNILLIGLAVTLYIFLSNLMVVAMAIILIVIINYLLINSFSTRKNKILMIRDEEFITLITYFQSFIYNGDNVYVSFRKCLQYCSLWMKEAIQELLEEIDSDKSLKPYLNFSKKFTKSYVETTMISIYQMVDEGEKDSHLNHFNSLFDQISLVNNKDKIDAKKKSLDSFAVYPLIGAGIITILLTVGIITIIGDMVNVF